MSEEEVRKMRDKCFEHTISDEDWDKVKSNWMEKEEQEWLKEHTK